MTTNFHEDRMVGLILTFIGGAMDAYTYIHYDVFASAQTGNVILAIIQGFDGEWSSVWKKILSIMCFFTGILLAKYAIDFFKKKQIHYWRLFILYFEALVFLVVGLPLVNSHSTFVTVLIAFTAAVQWVAFDKIDGKTYTSLFTTGNIKGLAVNFYEYLKTRETQDKENFLHFFRVVFSFVLGAILSIYSYHLLNGKAVMLIAAILFVLAIYETIMVLRFYRLNQMRK